MLGEILVPDQGPRIEPSPQHKVGWSPKSLGHHGVSYNLLIFLDLKKNVFLDKFLKQERRKRSQEILPNT